MGLIDAKHIGARVHQLLSKMNFTIFYFCTIKKQSDGAWRLKIMH